ncbi:MAG: DUF937 domain-containing protein [Bacteroidota bacterium]
MTDLLNTLTSTLGGDTTSQLASAIGASPQQTQQGIAAAMPMLLGQLNRNTNTPEGAQALAGALDRDHDGSVLGLLGGGGLGSLLGGLTGGTSQPQSGMDLGSLLGGLTGGGSAQGGGLGGLLGQLTGGGQQQSGGLEGMMKAMAGQAILGHIFGDKLDGVSSAIAGASGLDKQQSGNLLGMIAPMLMGALGKVKRDQGLDASGVSDLLNQESAQARQATSAGLLGSLASALDSDGDGDLKDELLQKAAGAALGKLFGR